jgi:hypothetical protein
LGRKAYKALAQKSAYVALSRGLNFVWFAFTLFWFWSDWKQIGKIWGVLAWFQWLGVWIMAWLAATIVLASWEWLRATLLSIKLEQSPLLTSRYARVVYASVLGLASIVIKLLLNQPAPDIVYKAF